MASEFSPKECEAKHAEVWRALRGKAGLGLVLVFFATLFGVFVANSIWAASVANELSAYKQVKAIETTQLERTLSDIQAKVNELYYSAIKDGKVIPK